MSNGVDTPCGHSTLTPMPRSLYSTDSHWASPIAACLVAEYGASPGAISNPAADTVLSRYPRPRSSMPGSTARAA